MELPSATTRTLAEVNCRLCDIEASNQSLSAPACPDIFIQSGQNPTIDSASIPVRSPAGVWPLNYKDATSNGGEDNAGPSLSLQTLIKPAFDHVKATLSQLRNLTGSRKGAHLDHSCQSPSPSSASWHPTQPLLAAVDDSKVDTTLQVFDFSDKIPYLGQQTQSSIPPLSPTIILHHELQQSSSSSGAPLAWRPTNSTSTAVGCAHGVCLWLNIPTRKQSSTPDVSPPSLVWLQSPGEVPVDALCWHPRGHLLAGASHHCPGLFIWDVATGSVTRISAGVEHVTMLRWSPCGCYLFAGGRTGSFRIWETVNWKSAKWALGGGGSTLGSTSRGSGISSSRSGDLVGAEWSPDGRTLLLAHSHQVSALHLTAEVPALTAQVLPVPLAELTSSSSDSGGNGIPSVQSVAWDPRGQRLAIALEFKKKEGKETQTQSTSSCIVALYDARCDPILTARFIGYARVVPMNQSASRGDPDWEIVEREEEVQEEEEQQGGAVAASSSEKVSMVFMPSFEQGAVLSVRKGGFIGTLPMYFSL